MKIFYYFSIGLLFANCTTQKLSISQINFDADACFGTCPVFTMIISSDGTAHYNAKMYNERKGQFTTIIRPSQFDSLTNLIAKSDFFNLKNEYSTDWTDHPTYSLTIKLKNGKNKTISDYGPSGPDKHKKIYYLIFSLRETQNWE